MKNLKRENLKYITRLQNKINIIRDQNWNRTIKQGIGLKSRICMVCGLEIGRGRENPVTATKDLKFYSRQGTGSRLTA